MDDSLWAIALDGLAVACGVMAAVWLLGAVTRNVGIIDVFWGICIAAVGISFASAQPLLDTRSRLVLALVLIWAIRLALHIFWRGWGEPEDRRYRAMRERWDPGFWWKSLFIVYATQAVLAWIIAMPILGITQSARPLGILDYAGFVLWLFGFVVETAADWQLARFLTRPDRGNAVMDQGLWKYSRHPNYFGEFCLWWGIYLFALSAGAWWTIFAPLLLTFLLLRVSGVALTEQTIGERRPGYAEYVRKTSAFVLRPPRP